MLIFDVNGGFYMLYKRFCPKWESTFEEILTLHNQWTDHSLITQYDMLIVKLYSQFGMNCLYAIGDLEFESKTLGL